jgi:hypothetical protein
VPANMGQLMRDNRLRHLGREASQRTHRKPFTLRPPMVHSF